LKLDSKLTFQILISAIPRRSNPSRISWQSRDSGCPRRSLF